MNEMHTHWVRLIRACGAIALIILALAVAIWAGADAEAGFAGEGRAAQGASMSKIWRQATETGDVASAMTAHGYIALNEDTQPHWMPEVCDLAAFEGGYATPDNMLVQLEYSGTADEADEFLHAVLSSRGWIVCDSGYDGVATYIKEKGECRWLMSECVGVGDTASIVLHIKLA